MQAQLVQSPAQGRGRQVSGQQLCSASRAESVRHHLSRGDALGWLWPGTKSHASQPLAKRCGARHKAAAIMGSMTSDIS